MQSKCIDLKFFLNIDKTKVVSTLNNETIISSHDYIDKKIKVFVYNYYKKNADLETPVKSYISFKEDVKSYDLITNYNEIIVYVLINEFLEKYVFYKNNFNNGISPSGDNGNQKHFYLEKVQEIPAKNSVGIKISRNGSILCIFFKNGDIFVYDTKKFFESEKESYLILQTSNGIQVTIKDISPDACSLITQCKQSSKCILWNIEKNKNLAELIHTNENCEIVDCLFGRIEAVSHIYNIYAIYNSKAKNKYFIAIWNCSTYSIKESQSVESKISHSICVSNEGRYVAVNCFEDYSIDIFISFNLNKLYTYSNIKSISGSWLCHFLPLSFSIDKFIHEFDLLSFCQFKESTSIIWLYEPMRQNYSVIWPVSAAVILIFALFYFVIQYGL